ncbi:MAG TPA: molybdenum cofactor biosynthesis protein MoaE [Candidatus Baltobacteraceae bacterium]|nr:molybdenum cofactor biosynthesis protein MoaE [Candidatus Baltobacteraceae bacterium]
MIELSEAPLELDALVAAVRTDACGAVVTFLGVVRESSEDARPVAGLSYEAYADMALPEMRAIADEASRTFGGARVAIVHRTGRLALGEASVAVAVAAPHRAVAFDACEFAIDELKRRVPIWKKEHYRDGAAGWRENRAP